MTDVVASWKRGRWVCDCGEMIAEADVPCKYNNRYWVCKCGTLWRYRWRHVNQGGACSRVVFSPGRDGGVGPGDWERAVQYVEMVKEAGQAEFPFIEWRSRRAPGDSMGAIEISGHAAVKEEGSFNYAHTVIVGMMWTQNPSPVARAQDMAYRVAVEASWGLLRHEGMLGKDKLEWLRTLIG